MASVEKVIETARRGSASTDHMAAHRGSFALAQHRACLPLEWNFAQSVGPRDGGIFSACLGSVSARHACFHRHRANKMFIDGVFRDTVDGSEREVENWSVGEDPRVFSHAGHVYVLSNRINKMEMIEVVNGTASRRKKYLDLNGKNLSPVSVGVLLFFFDFERQTAVQVVREMPPDKVGWDDKFVNEPRKEKVLRSSPVWRKLRSSLRVAPEQLHLACRARHAADI